MCSSDLKEGGLQGLATCDHNPSAWESRGLIHQPIQRHFPSAARVPRVFRVAPRATYGATLEADKDDRDSCGDPLSLDGEKTLGDSATLVGHSFSEISSLEHSGVSSILTRKSRKFGGKT